jgi:hypothetical protein
MVGWLFTIEERQRAPKLGPGVEFEAWTEAPRLTSNGQIRRRSDGNPYTPAWDRGDRAIVFHPDTERCWAVLRVDGHAVWDERRELFFTLTTIEAVDPTGPRLADIGVEKALQGGRHRLTHDQLRASLNRFGLG